METPFGVSGPHLPHRRCRPGVRLPTILPVLGHAYVTANAIYTAAVTLQTRDLLARM